MKRYECCCGTTAYGLPLTCVLHAAAVPASGSRGPGRPGRRWAMVQGDPRCFESQGALESWHRRALRAGATFAPCSYADVTRFLRKAAGLTWRDAESVQYVWARRNRLVFPGPGAGFGRHPWRREAEPDWRVAVAAWFVRRREFARPDKRRKVND